MDTEITPTQLAIEYLRRDKSNLSPAQYLKKLKQLELEFTDLLALSSNELKEEIYFACVGVISVSMMSSLMYKT